MGPGGQGVPSTQLAAKYGEPAVVTDCPLCAWSRSQQVSTDSPAALHELDLRRPNATYLRTGLLYRSLRQAPSRKTVRLSRLGPAWA